MNDHSPVVMNFYCWVLLLLGGAIVLELIVRRMNGD